MDFMRCSLAKPALRMAFFLVLGLSPAAMKAADVNDLARRFNAQIAANDLANAEATARQALAQIERNRDPAGTFDWLGHLGRVIQKRGRLAEAKPLLERALMLEEQRRGRDHLNVAFALNDLANLLVDAGDLAKAEPLFQRSLAIREKVTGKESPEVATALNNIGKLYSLQSRLAEAEAVYKRALAIRERKLGPKSNELASTVNNLGVVYLHLGRYVDAEPLFRRALAIYEGSQRNSPETADELNNLSLVFFQQGRYAESEAYARRALAINEKIFGDHPRVAMNLTNIANVAMAQNRFSEAAPLYRRALALNEEAFGAEHPEVARATINLAGLYQRLGDYDRASALFRRSAANLEAVLGADHSAFAHALYSQAVTRHNQSQPEEAERLLTRALGILDKTGALPDIRFKCYLLRAEIRWRGARRPQAISDVSQGIEIAELQRTRVFGGERERAESFALFSRAYEHLAEWQRELGAIPAAFSAVEQSRVRSLFDQMQAAHIDLMAGLAEEIARPLRTREQETQSRLADLEKQWETAASAKDLSESERTAKLEALQKTIARARQDWIEANTAMRNASPAYRKMVANDFRAASLDAVQKTIGARQIILEYVIGDSESSVIVIGPPGQPARMLPLVVEAEQARELHISQGMLTKADLRAAITGGTEKGILQRLRSRQDDPGLNRKLATLWQVLVPAEERSGILAGNYDQLTIIPDGTLSMLPFEALVVEQTGSRYLIDLELSVLYAPSATLLWNLRQGNPSVNGNSKNAALSVGDAIYGQAITGAKDASRSQLQPLPKTAIESKWVVEILREMGLDVSQLSKDEATEARIRAAIPGRQYLHFACHGIVDQESGNLFGGLAFSKEPRGQSDTRNDGLLTMAEIYSLDLRQCSLAVLSACDTNFGPEQQGEGSWALSRGFLVAGARRVVATNWLVDDEAASYLVSYFWSSIAKSEQRNAGTTDYAAALATAKRSIRQQEKWASPHYWASFVLIGPN